MTFEDLPNRAADAWAATRQTNPEVLLTVAVLILAGLIVLRIATSAASLALARRKIGKPHYLAIRTVDAAPVDEIRMNAATMNGAGLAWGTTVRIQGLGQAGTGKTPLVGVRRRNSLDDDVIELSPDLQILLFTDRPDGPPKRNFAFSAKVKPGGLREFWDHPNPQLRFQNRLSLYLAFGLTVFQLGWAWITKT